LNLQPRFAKPYSSFSLSLSTVCRICKCAIRRLRFPRSPPDLRLNSPSTILSESQNHLRQCPNPGGWVLAGWSEESAETGGPLCLGLVCERVSNSPVDCPIECHTTSRLRFNSGIELSHGKLSRKSIALWFLYSRTANAVRGQSFTSAMRAI
jgi:hypothetical protein